jgi:putative two-component system response regulator
MTAGFVHAVPRSPHTEPGRHYSSHILAHQRRVGTMAAILAMAMGFGRAEAAAIGEAGRLHDVGKLFLPTAVLEKPGPLDHREQALVRRHADWGHAILSRSSDPELALAARVALEHHEHWDGTGYPFGLSGEQIGIEARIVTICDVYDALRERRAYRGALSHESAMAIIEHGDHRSRPGMFDPKVLAAMIVHQHKLRQVFDAQSRRDSPIEYGPSATSPYRFCCGAFRNGRVGTSIASHRT